MVDAILASIILLSFIVVMLVLLAGVAGRAEARVPDEQLQDRTDELSGASGNTGSPALGQDTLEGGASLLGREQSLLAEGAAELQSARSQYGRQYQLPDGRKAAIISAAPIHYEAPDGSYEAIDNTIVPLAEHKEYAFTNAANSFSIYFPGRAGP